MTLSESGYPSLLHFPAAYRIAIRLLASGESKAEVVRTTGISKQTLFTHLATDWAPFIEAYKTAPPIELTELLLFAERLATLKMIGMLHANGVMPADKFKIASDLLNRRGERGAPKTRAETKTVNVTNDVANQLASALRDPGVQKRLRDNPEVFKALAPAITEPDYETLPDASAEGGTAAIFSRHHEAEVIPAPEGTE